jgi:hypothetical protein
MKQKLLFLWLVLLAAVHVQGQSANPSIWCPTGATWTYNYGLFNEFGTLTVQYQRDTLVAGLPAQVLTRVLRTSFWVYYPTVSAPGSTYRLSNVITRVVGDRVEVQANGQFYTLYDFGALRGSSWLTVPVTPQGACPAGVVQVTVDSVGRQTVAGRSLRWFRAHLTAGSGTNIAGSWSGRIYEQLGNVMQYMQPQSPICRGTDPGYMGSLIGFRASGWPSIGYNATSGVLLSAQARATTAGFTVFPNPSAGSGHINVQLTATIGPGAQLYLLDLTGRQVLMQNAIVGESIDVSSLSLGTYTLRLRSPGMADLYQRIVLE